MTWISITGAVTLGLFAGYVKGFLDGLRYRDVHAQGGGYRPIDTPGPRVPPQSGTGARYPSALEHRSDGPLLCWCRPRVIYTDPQSGAKVIVHRKPD